MLYRDFGKTGFKVSALGFGCMRFPTVKEDGVDKIDEKKAIEMLRLGIDRGVNYIDTAYPYHGGESERLVAKALKDGYREKVKLATKLPSWLIRSREDFDRLLDEQLQKLEVETIDYYLVHALDKSRWDNLRENGLFDFIEAAKASGRIQHIGFSFHDVFSTFKEIVDGYDWEMCQIQLNILDEEYQAGVKGLKYAHAKGIPVVIMEPLKGGALVKNVPQAVLDIYDEAPVKRAPTEWAFRWLYDMPEVAIILSGMSTLEQTQENLKIFDASAANVLTEDERKIIERVQAYYRQIVKVGCTSCEYCLPCPAGVSINDVFCLYNEAFMFDDLEGKKGAYQRFVIGQSRDASLCIECGACESLCPQHIEIISKLKEAHAVLSV